MRSLLSSSLRQAVATRARALGSSRPLARGLSSFYNADVAGLTEDQNELRDAVSQFARAEIEPRAQEIDKNNQFPMDLWKKFGDMGLLGITVSEEDGGLAKGYLDHTIVMEGERFPASRLPQSF